MRTAAGPLHRHQPLPDPGISTSSTARALTDVLSRYTGLTGRPPLPPPWAFGPWISSDVWRNGGEVGYAVDQVPRAADPRLGIRLRLALGDRLQRLHSSTAKPIRRKGTEVQGTQDGAERDGFEFVDDRVDRDDDLLPAERPEGHLLDDAVRQHHLDNADVEDHGVEDRTWARRRTTKRAKTTASSSVQSKNGPPLVVHLVEGQGSPIDFTNPDARDWLTGQLKSTC